MNSSFSPLPYFDILLRELGRGNPQAERTFGANVHWGYWEDPERADLRLEAYFEAADRMNSEIFRELDARPGQKVLDAGCGFGGTLAALGRQVQGVRRVGLNIDPRQVARARAQVPDVEFVIADACRLPFTAAEFDSVMAVECIFHFPSRRDFFSEAHRVLKPGGTLVVSDFLRKPWTIPQQLLLFLKHRTATRRAYGHAALPLTPAGYRRLARSTGFETIRARDITRNTLPTYDVLRGLAAEMGQDGAALEAGTLFIERCSRRGYSPYYILTFRKTG
jgi:ubiquinone/menaquinone biosynthesis C-methylase UbiE